MPDKDGETTVIETKAVRRPVRKSFFLSKSAEGNRSVPSDDNIERTKQSLIVVIESEKAARNNA